MTRYSKLLAGAIAVLALCMVASCAKTIEPRESQGIMDNPEHHVATGLRYLEQEEYDKAEREFNLALELVKDRKYSRAHAGLGIVYAMKGDFKAAREAMEKAKDTMKEDQEKLDYHVGMIRVLSEERRDDWVDDAESHFKKAVKIDEAYSPAYYFMGLGYRKAYEFGKAGDMFQKVIEIDKGYVTQANDEWRLVQKIQRAAPGTLIGKKIALVDKMSRADVAALFVQELQLPELFEKRGRKEFDTSFKSPVKQFETEKIVKTEAATDIADHALRSDIEEVMKLGVRGLEPYPDHTWRPNELINRAEYAIMVEDALIKLTGDEKLATEFIGSKSPFPDLRSDAPYFNAIMVLTSRDLMEGGNISTGEFNPLGSIDGADALLVIRKLKDLLRL